MSSVCPPSPARDQRSWCFFHPCTEDGAAAANVSFLGWREGTGTGTTAGAQVANLRCHCCPHPSSALPMLPASPFPSRTILDLCPSQGFQAQPCHKPRAPFALEREALGHLLPSPSSLTLTHLRGPALLGGQTLHQILFLPPLQNLWTPPCLPMS